MSKAFTTAFRIVPLVVVIVLTAAAAHGQRSSQRGRLRPNAEVQAPTPAIVFDTISGAACDTLVRITGYEKPREATREMMFVQNLSGRQLESLEIELTYRTTDGVDLHKRAVCLPAQIPAGERRMLSFRSWDSNKVFYYHLNAPVTPRQATPYRVSIRVLHLYFSARPKRASSGVTTDSITL